MELTAISKKDSNRIVATIARSKLKSVYQEFRAGSPVTAQDLAQIGVSADLAVHYVRAGWLVRLARGVYARPNEVLELHACLGILQRSMVGLHVGGKSALDWHGIRQYVAQNPKVELYGWDATRLPEWFTHRFPAQYHRKRLFQEKADVPLEVAPFESRPTAAFVSSPERGLLELLSEVGLRQPLQEAQEILEATYTLRAGVLQALLLRCKSVKTVRLTLQLGREMSMPWAEKLDSESLPTGSRRPWVGRSKEGRLVLAP